MLENFYRDFYKFLRSNDSVDTSKSLKSKQLIAHSLKFKIHD